MKQFAGWVVDVGVSKAGLSAGVGLLTLKIACGSWRDCLHMWIRLGFGLLFSLAVQATLDFAGKYQHLLLHRQTLQTFTASDTTTNAAINTTL